MRWFGIIEKQQAEVARSAYSGLYALQHRGQESCGIAVSSDGVFRQHRGDGLVGEVFLQDAFDHLGRGESPLVM